MTDAMAVIDRSPALPLRDMPKLYLAARTALERCGGLEECEAWTDKAKALAAYAQAARDEGLLHTALRIRLRAIRRAGDLLLKLPHGVTGRPFKGAVRRPTARQEVARRAGMTKADVVRAVRLAQVPFKEFEGAVERPKPATLSELERMGMSRVRAAEGLTGDDRTRYVAARDARRARDRLRLTAAWLKAMTSEGRASLLAHSDEAQRVQLRRALLRLRKAARVLLAELPARGREQ